MSISPHPQRSTLFAALAASALIGALLAACNNTNAGPVIPSTVTGPTIGSGGSAADTTAASVQMLGQRFIPQTDTISVGSAVTWTNGDAVDHTVTADDGSFDSGPIPTSGSFRHTFDQAGSFAYHDSIFGAPGSGMYGTVVVE